MQNKYCRFCYKVESELCLQAVTCEHDLIRPGSCTQSIHHIVYLPCCSAIVDTCICWLNELDIIIIAVF